MEKKHKKEYTRLNNGTYKYVPKKKVMFNKSIEKMFESHSQRIKSKFKVFASIEHTFYKS